MYCIRSAVVVGWSFQPFKKFCSGVLFQLAGLGTSSAATCNSCHSTRPERQHAVVQGWV